MGKAVKKKSRRLGRTIRKTLGTLFLVSALVIAAIPVDGLQAAQQPDTVSGNTPGISRPTDKVIITSGTTLIPTVAPTEQIYTTADGKFQFAYVNAPDSGSARVAVILGCAKGSVVGTDLTLSIPPTVDAYKLYSISQGTTGGYVAAGWSGNALFYAIKTYYTKLDDDGKVIYTDANGNPSSVAIENESLRKYLPCYASDDAWKSIPINELYYVPNEGLVPGATGNDYIQTTEATHQRIVDAEVWYIGNQCLQSEKETINGIDYTKWKVGGEITNPTDGVFATIGATTITGSDKLHGIGNYAFYQCQRLGEFKACVNLREIGNYAFAGCANLQGITDIINANLIQIGKGAFKDCTSLLTFDLPASTNTIGDAAFENCIALSTVDLCSKGKEGALNKMGYDVFKNCEALLAVAFPYSYTETVDLSEFYNCPKLQSVTARNPNMNFKADEGFDVEAFRKMVDKTFYFEGIENSTAHRFANDNFFAFSLIESKDNNYAKRDIYELSVQEKDAHGNPTGNKSIFRVNSSNQLISCEFEGNIETLEFPKNIGPYGINTITPERFMNQCNLKKVVIPSMVENVGDRAFQGCHNLQNVVFESGSTTIGTDAFKTQHATTHLDNCTRHEDNGTVSETYKVPLHFTTPVSSDSKPFLYAMNENGKYTNSYQTPAYITCFSGLPQNLEIEYNPDTKMSEVVDFPSISDLRIGTKYNVDNYSYLSVDDQKAIENAFTKYSNGEQMSDAESEILDSVLNIEIPDGVQSIRSGLIKQKEKDDLSILQNDATLAKTFTAYSLVNVEEGKKDAAGTYTGTFAGCEYLKGVYLLEGNTGAETTVGDYAFLDCKMLDDVSMSKYVKKLGKVPFYGCENLSFVNFQDNPYYTCSDKSIIYGKDGEKLKSVVECLQGRNPKYRQVTTSELGPTIDNMEEEAFRGSSVQQIDLSATNIPKIPVGAFAQTENLTEVWFPDTLTLIDNFAFAGSAVTDFYVKGKNTSCSPFAFYGDNENHDSMNRYGFAGLATTDPSVVMWNYAKGGTTSKATGEAQGFSTEPTDFPTSYYVVFTYRQENGEFVDERKDERADSVENAERLAPEIPQKVIVNGMTYRFLDTWSHTLENENTLHFTADYDFDMHVITFMDSKDGVKKICDMDIADGGNAIRKARDIPELAKIMEDPNFVTWDCEGNLEEVDGDYTAVARYRKEGEYIVRFFVRKGSISNPYEMLYSTTVNEGKTAPSIEVPEVEGYKFTEWDKPLTNITEDTDFYARYEPSSGDDPNNPDRPDNPNNPDDPNNPDNPNNPGDPNNPGNTGSSNNPGNSGGNNGGTGSGNNPGDDVERHTLQVRGGSGSGYYAAGEQVIITADEPAKGQQFSSWTVSPASTSITDKNMSSAIISMPNNDVAVIANYKARSSTTGSGNAASTNTNRPNGTTGKVGGTTVVIDKNGLSNTGVVSATVNGSSDNFTIKITESGSATEAVLRALQAEYGTLDNIKYFPMDISLYDSTGNTKITDTTGLSVSITLPLPDSLITYAGNNKVAGVVNDRLDKLTPKFTTIDGVPCITFTAEHFSPYVIYVDLVNLSDGTIPDNTPTTGDGIHPKWFLSIGLACLSFVMFMMKDSKGSKKKQKVAVRAR